MTIDLFADIPSEVVHHSDSSKDPVNKLAKKVWSEWCLLTQRDDSRKVNQKVVAAIKSAFSGGLEEDAVLEATRGAARTAPRPKDKDDVRRLTAAISTASVRKVALAALREDLPVIPRESAKENLTLKEIAAILETSQRSWTDRDIEAASILMSYTEEELIQAADATGIALKERAVFPAEVLRYGKSKVKPKVTSARNSYSAGEIESARTEGIDFFSDKDADRAYNKGVNLGLIRKFHNLAPEGYWREVQKLMKSGDKSHDDVYSMLEEKFAGWHPSIREPISGSKGRK